MQDELQDGADGLDPSAISQDGNQMDGRYRFAGLEGLAVAQRTGGQYSFIKEMLTGSADWKTIFARTELTKEEIDRLIRLIGKRNCFYYGRADEMGLYLLRVNLLISKDRKGRTEAVQVETGRRNWLASMMGRQGPRGMFKRARTIGGIEDIPDNG